MTLSTVVFDPFSEEFFNGPYETYRRMREEAPVYYSDEYDFYALSRHADVAAAFRTSRPTRRPAESILPWCATSLRRRTSRSS